MRYLFLILILLSSVFAKEVPQKLVVQLHWKPQFEFAGFYMAQELGYYKAAGLNIKINHYLPTSSQNVKDILLGHKADIALGYSNIVADAIENKNILILSYLFQHSPHVALAKKATKNLKNTCLYLSKSEYKSVVDLMFLKLQNKCRKKYSLSAFNNDKQNKVILTSFISNPVLKSGKYKTINPRQYGWDFYDDIIYTNTDFYKKHKQAVRKFILATLKGWRYALRHIPQTADILHKKYTKNISIKDLVYEANKLKEFTIDDISRIGIFDTEKLKRMQTGFYEFSLIDHTKKIYKIVDPLFLNYIDLNWHERELVATTKLRYSETNWPPFSILKNKKLTGTIPDYLKLISQKSGLDFEYIYVKRWPEVLQKVKTKQLDMAMATGETSSRKEYAVFSIPYGTYSFAIVSKKGTLLCDPSELKGKTIAVGDNYTSVDILQKYYKQTKKKIVPTDTEGLKLLANSKVDGLLDIYPTLSYFLSISNYNNLMISTVLPQKFELKAMFRKDYAEIKDIFNKALLAVSDFEKQKIQNKYTNKIIYQINTQKEHMFLTIISLLVFILVVVIYFSYRLKKELKRRIEVEDELNNIANRDPLTNLYNRRFFTTLMEQELARLKRDRGVILFAIYDYDNFKSYNDHYGHQAGDALLQKISKTMQNLYKRDNDYIFRLGGEEFGIYTHIQNIEKTKIFIQNNIKTIESLQIEHKYNQPYGIITISLGAVIVTVTQNSTVTLETIYKYADDLMYEAKEKGRNQAIIKSITV